MRFCSCWFELGRKSRSAPSSTTTPTASARKRFANLVSVNFVTLPLSVGGGDGLGAVGHEAGLAVAAPGALTARLIFVVGSDDVNWSR